MKKEIIIERFNGEKMRFERAGSVILGDDGVVRFEGMPARCVREMKRFGAVGLGKHGVKYPRDGAVFLRALRMECNRTTLFRASTRRGG